MNVETKHPAYTNIRVSEFELMLHSMGGEGEIKNKGEAYLPKPSGFGAMSDQGTAMYKAYKGRATFPEILAPTISAMVGIIHGKEIAIVIPDSMKYLNQQATKSSLSLEAFHRRITAELLKSGRYAVLADAPKGGGEPYLCGYFGSSVINWDTDFFVIDDSGKVREDYVWKDQKSYLTLKFDDAYSMVETIDTVNTEYKPTGTGKSALTRIPFVVANAKDISADMIAPPLIGVSRAALAIYQLSADYRHQLFMSGQETLVAINGDAPTQIGAGVVHSMIGSEGATPDLKYVSPTCAGIEAHKIAMQDYREAAVMAGAKLIEQEKGNAESGYSRKLRFSSETATLTTIAKVSCEVLEQSLRNIAMMQGLSDNQQKEITVTPPKDLLDTAMEPQDVKALVESWQAGGFSYRTLFENLLKGGVANPERELEDELLEMDDDPEALRKAQEDALAPENA